MAERGEGKTPLRNIRVPDATWLPALARARREGTTVSAVVRGKLEEYGQGHEDWCHTVTGCSEHGHCTCEVADR